MQLATLTNRRPSERLDLLRLRNTKEVLLLNSYLSSKYVQSSYVRTNFSVLTFDYCQNLFSCIIDHILSSHMGFWCRGSIEDWFIWRQKNKDVDYNESDQICNNIPQRDCLYAYVHVQAIPHSLIHLYKWILIEKRKETGRIIIFLSLWT